MGVRKLEPQSRSTPLSDVARFGSTSVTMLERVCAHLLNSSVDDARDRLDAFSARLGQERAAR
jgi:hypothetical protein